LSLMRPLGLLKEVTNSYIWITLADNLCNLGKLSNFLSLSSYKNWLNIYDLRDFLSYVGNQDGLFAGKMTDVLVDNRQPFPEAHGAYWANDATWDAITDFLP
ncbi:hypothetical protein VB741_12800, partial [Leptothoe sp. PORK10 BA2]